MLCFISKIYIYVKYCNNMYNEFNQDKIIELTLEGEIELSLKKLCIKKKNNFSYLTRLMRLDKTFKCQRCNKIARHVHHIDSNHNNNKINNLSVLCITCHKRQHNHNPLIRNTNIKIIRKIKERSSVITEKILNILIEHKGVWLSKKDIVYYLNMNRSTSSISTHFKNIMNKNKFIKKRYVFETVLNKNIFKYVDKRIIQYKYE